MLKWLVTGREEGSLPTITDDPLATIPRAKKDRRFLYKRKVDKL